MRRSLSYSLPSLLSCTSYGLVETVAWLERSSSRLYDKTRVWIKLIATLAFCFPALGLQGHCFLCQDLPTCIFWPVMDVFLAAAINASAQSSKEVWGGTRRTPLHQPDALDDNDTTKQRPWGDKTMLTSCFSTAFSFNAWICSSLNCIPCDHHHPMSMRAYNHVDWWKMR